MMSFSFFLCLSQKAPVKTQIKKLNKTICQVDVVYQIVMKIDRIRQHQFIQICGNLSSFFVVVWIHEKLIWKSNFKKNIWNTKKFVNNGFTCQWFLVSNKKQRRKKKKGKIWIYLFIKDVLKYRKWIRIFWLKAKQWLE